ncbi:M56 family metallopeptidase [Bailinhaonella thermotolerans]|uniref:M56 family peptidase n=1 Tax=Bailinhaonella thermotolerans TaxID=1070861 RepID=A0A3A4AQZ3_9ACTN|nr:M56 family metallopeptidase [Bailinhaonella thermotolerans]RJL30835.1 M56 family peptidase [Bailinhaonella thermotolerans]
MIVLAFAVLAAICVLGAVRLRGAKWPWRDPRPVVVLWQALGLTWGLATTGALFAYGVEPFGLGVFRGLVALTAETVVSGPPPLGVDHYVALLLGTGLLGLLVGVLAVATVHVFRARRRHRAMLSLVGRGTPEVPGVLVLDHPAAAAYCVPGLRPQVVISEGTLRLLKDAELAAVLSHEEAHVRERHDLVLLPFAALRKALPFSEVVREAQSSVALLVEMCADDHARKRHGPRLLATALLRFGAAGHTPAPHGALGTVGSAQGEMLARVDRLLTPGPALPLRLRLGLFTVSTLLLLAPPLLWFLPA